MIKIKKFGEIKNTLFNKLFERNMETIQSFRITDDIDLGIFELFYELEYKYSQIQDRLFKGIEKRRENILRIIEDKAEEVNEAIADSFTGVFKTWLDSHALTEPRKWAEQRVYGEDEDLISVLTNAFIEYEKYTGADFGGALGYIGSHDEFPYLRDLIIDAVKEWYQADLEEGWDEFYEMHEDLLEDLGIEKKEDINIDLMAKTAIKNRYVDPTDIIDSISTLGQMIQNSFDDPMDYLVEIYENLVFPAWYDHWKAQGIDKTRKDVEDIYKKIKRISSYPIEKQFMYINMATNTTHQTGSMMDYYEEQYAVMKTDLERLSNMDTRNWDKELKEIGVDI